MAKISIIGNGSMTTKTYAIKDGRSILAGVTSVPVDINIQSEVCDSKGCKPMTKEGEIKFNKGVLQLKKDLDQGYATSNPNLDSLLYGYNDFASSFFFSGPNLVLLI